MGDDKARYLSTKEVPGFDALSGGFAHDGWSPFGTTGDASDAAKWAVQRESLFSAVSILDLAATPVSRSSFALNLEGFDEKLPFSPSFENNNSPGGKNGSSNHRRRSSLSSLSDLKKRDSVATFLSSGDSSFDQALDAWFQKKKEPEENNKKKKKEDSQSDLEPDLLQLEEVPRKRRPDDRPPEKRRPDDRAPEKTPENTTTFRRNNAGSKKGGMRRTQTSDGMARPSNVSKKSKRRQSVGGGGLMKDESDRTAANNRFLASKALMKDESATKSSTRRSREDRHKEEMTTSINNRSKKSLGSLLMKDESISGSARTQESRHRKTSKSPSRGRTKRTENRKERSSAPVHSSSNPLHKSSSSGMFSVSSDVSALTSYSTGNSKFHKSSGSLETQGVVASFRRTPSLEEKVANNNKSRPVAKAIANIISSSTTELLPELQLHRSESEMGESARTHESSRTLDSSVQSTSRSRSPKPPKSNQSSRSPSRGAGGRSKGKSSRGDRDRSRSSSSQSRRKNKAATAAADTSLLGGTGSTHSEREDMDALFDEIKTHKKKPATRSGRRKIDKKLSESVREGGSSRRNHNDNNKKEKGLRRVKTMDFDGPAVMRDKSSASHRTGRWEDKATRRGRRTGSVEAPRGRRTVSVEDRGRSAEQQPEAKARGSGEAPKLRRTGSVEAPRRRRGPSQEPRGRRAPSVDAKSRRAPSQEPRGRRAPSVDAQSRRAPSQEPRGRRAPSVDAQSRLRDKQLTQSVAAIPEPSFGRSKAQPDAAESNNCNESGEEESADAPPVNLPSISGLTGGEVPTWKMQGNKTKAQPRDQDDKATKKDKEANKGRRFTQMVWKSRIKEAKSR